MIIGKDGRGFWVIPVDGKVVFGLVHDDSLHGLPQLDLIQDLVDRQLELFGEGDDGRPDDHDMIIGDFDTAEATRFVAGINKAIYEAERQNEKDNPERS